MGSCKCPSRVEVLTSRAAGSVRFRVDRADEVSDDARVTDDASRELTAALAEVSPVVTPADPGFDPAGLVAFDPGSVTPVAIVRPRDAAEVTRLLPLVSQSGVPLAVRGGGHSYASHGLVDGGVVLDLAALDAVTIDPASRVGRAGGGATAGRYTALAAEHGLATGFGDTASVGVAGIALGGGIGFLSRRFGLVVDDLVGAEVVTSDGRVLTVDDEHEPELFWALRGGGGGFGVVTELSFRLHEVSTVTHGMLMFEPDPDVLATLVALLADAPDGLSSMANVMAAPPMPMVPAELHGRPVLMVRGVHSRAPDEGRRLFDEMRALSRPLLDMVAEAPYPAVLGEMPYKGLGVTSDCGFADDFGPSRAARAIEAVTPGSRIVVNLRPMGGAIARVAPDATAFAHRGRRVMVVVASLDQSRAAASAAAGTVAELTRTLSDGSDGYVNFLGAISDGAARAYPSATLQRLAEAKTAYDPGNLFRNGHTVVPI